MSDVRLGIACPLVCIMLWDGKVRQARILKNAFLTAQIRRKGQMLGDVEAPSHHNPNKAFKWGRSLLKRLAVASGNSGILTSSLSRRRLCSCAKADLKIRAEGWPDERWSADMAMVEPGTGEAKTTAAASKAVALSSQLEPSGYAYSCGRLVSVGSGSARQLLGQFPLSHTSC